ncbi:unnamed protein product [Ilex paraguariensis]|uniref:Uncharacterized protein n=1 Tax=Ilex paraguariensis TaxID=185542 RepID=A0ABC8R751_9AQUA
MLKGVEDLADAVKATMGPKGRNVALEQSFGVLKVTNNGVTVGKIIEFKDRFKNIGASLVKQVGTTYATILTHAICSEGCKSVAAGMNAMDLRRGISMAVDGVVTNLKSRAWMISTSEEIAQVGTISANGEREIGELIAKAMEKVHKEGVITISELEYPLILIPEKKISSLNAVVKVLELGTEEAKVLLIVAEDVESEVLATLILNKLQARIKVCAIKAPGLGEKRNANLEDLAILTGHLLGYGTVILVGAGARKPLKKDVSKSVPSFSHTVSLKKSI